MAEVRRWSLAKRMTGWLVTTTVGLVICVSALGAWYIDRTINREFNALVAEELDEMQAIFRGRTITNEAIAQVVVELANNHTGVTMAWRLYGAQGADLLGDFGNLELFDEWTPELVALGETTTPLAGLRWRIAEHILAVPGAEPGGPTGSAVWIGLLIDGRERLATLRSFATTALLLLIGAGSITVLGGLIFCRRASGMLRNMADTISNAPLTGLNSETVSLEGAPEEIRAVTEAITNMLRSLRSEQERARLLTAGMAHELRSPVQNLLGETEVVLLRDRDSAEYRRVLQSHLEELRDFGRVVDNLVTLCAVHESHQGRAIERFDIGHEAELRLVKERSVASSRSIYIEFLRRGDLNLHGDREAIMLAIRNLVSNAIHWSEDRGTVKVRIDGESDQIEITVDDDGPGVPEEERAKIFEPFFTGPVRCGRRAGYGLGLALTRTAVEAHGGSIVVESAPSGGARFRIQLSRNGAG